MRGHPDHGASLLHRHPPGIGGEDQKTLSRLDFRLSVMKVSPAITIPKEIRRFSVARSEPYIIITKFFFN